MKSKRLWIAIGCLVINYAVFTYLVKHGSDPSAIGAGLAFLNAPLLVYILGETYRPSYGIQAEKDK